jgi:glycosylphosphatidylinositol phospholipase D
MLAIALAGVTPNAIAEPFPAVFELSSLDGTNGFTMSGAGIDIAEFCGVSIDGGGDVNADGFRDVIVGAWGANVFGPAGGTSYVIYGRDDGFPALFDRSWLNGENGAVLYSLDAADDRSGYSVAGAGDMNGDGIGDLIIAGPTAGDPNPPDSGRSYVVFGTASGFPAGFELGTLDGTNGFVLVGTDEDDGIGLEVSDAGDLNGDGFDDVVIGAPIATTNVFEQGHAYVVFGHAPPFPGELPLAALDGSNGFLLAGIYPRSRAGNGVSHAGDVNGDGFDDIVIGAPKVGGDFTNGWGQTYVVFGSSAGYPAVAELSALDGTNGFRINGTHPDDASGYSVSGAGDINGDGVDDLVIGAPNAQLNPFLTTGKAFVVFGQAATFTPDLPLSSLDGDNGFEMTGVGSVYFTGGSVSEAGDLNDDGIGDVVIGAPFSASYESPGWAYVVFGSNAGFPASLSLSALDGSNGFALKGVAEDSHAGYSVSGAGDVNGDGVDDLVIGAPEWDGSQGQTYVVFGRARDTDADGVRDVLDNCTLAENADQRDTDNDGFGNVCDADLDGNCNVDFGDLGIMKSVFFTSDPDADLDGNGDVQFVDLGILQQLFFAPPGPSGVPNACGDSG